MPAVRQQDRVQAAFLDSDGDRAIDIAERLVGSDPHDPTSFPEDTGGRALSGLPLCSDGVDNDKDGLTDGADPGCHDSDGDLVSDPVEQLLGSEPLDANSFPEDIRLDAVLDFFARHERITCTDGIDNDLDGLTDAADPGCGAIDSDADGFDDTTEKRSASDPSNAASTPEHDVANPGSCSDGIDNDLDGLTDAADPACRLPTNDNRATARLISALPFTDSIKVLSATTETGEALPTCVLDPQSVTNTVWYKYTATGDALLTVDTVGSDFDTVLAVRPEADPGSELACNDNYFGVNVVQSGLTFRAVTGETYFFQIGRTSDASPYAGSLFFTLGVATPLPNDNMANATVIATLPFVDGPLSMRFATLEPNEPMSTCHFGGAVSSVWYRLTPASNALLFGDAGGSDFATVIAVWTESGLGLGQVACNNAFGRTSASPLTFRVAAGETYLIQVTQLSSTFGPPSALGLTFHLGSAVAGDSNCDGRVDSVDAAVILQFSARLLSSLGCPQNSDVNASGQADTLDAALILQYSAGLIGQLPP